MIEATALTKRYGVTTAVNELTFTAQSGRVTGFLGPNGAGKSTTMRLILGLDRPDAGRVLVDGVPYRQLKDPLRTVGAMLDATWRHPGRSGRDHLRWLAATNGIPDKRVEEVLTLVGLTSVGNTRVLQYSLGMQQRLGIAAALLGDPRVLLFDEPVNGLDPEGMAWIRQLLHALAAEGRTVFVSSHLLPEMAQTAQDLVVIGRGRLIYQGTMDEFIAQTSEHGVRVRTPHADRLRAALTGQAEFTEADGAFVVSGVDSDRIGQLAFDAGATLHELSPLTGSLEQAYLDLTRDAVEFAVPSSEASR
ncbi:multidrug ABC transporter ATPase [Amycolatopsis mediterranei S699]|uniref:ATPase component of ABC-type multidrug transport system n=2 Tax=Amycolatopsis mediterranei TaxID=33910 RepID=A0A0H3DL72_AMYMU|nr:ATP-binding cassette domain-containing protein [Amycolatopsis mediterranei]ADJ50953.1 ATPase component of ABC-type multidrug transport system [Amycolatopsis mediterranei U32]AEK47968.1 multidrug ABC transporter ATPase [Amycolatopsis mediterranei S699]AFO82659.1 multidrug ABC transporter ATPase [Amycolatopsis mediterranei S699]AGT89788.1 multidrug ABC transporter ATPase [Amycolatopsis mediterranei RB]KDO12053.1 ABC transporter [Amycolatopsis mediterranei]